MRLVPISNESYYDMSSGKSYHAHPNTDGSCTLWEKLNEGAWGRRPLLFEDDELSAAVVKANVIYATYAIEVMILTRELYRRFDISDIILKYLCAVFVHDTPTIVPSDDINYMQCGKKITALEKYRVDTTHTKKLIKTTHVVYEYMDGSIAEESTISTLKGYTDITVGTKTGSINFVKGWGAIWSNDPGSKDLNYVSTIIVKWILEKLAVDFGSEI